MRFFLPFLVVLLVGLPGFADFNGDARGTTTANFLKLGVGARAVGMGEAYAAAADDATALYWNPAGLTRVDGSAATFMHAPYIDSTFYDYGAYAYRRGRHAFGVGMQYFSAGSIPQTDENDVAQGTFSPYDLAVSAGYAYRLLDDGLSLGGSLKFIESRILATARTTAVDLGVQSGLLWKRVRLAMTLTNMGGGLKFEEETDPLPFAMRYGAAVQLTRHWLAAMDLVSPRDNGAYAALGTEYALVTSHEVRLSGRLGYNSLTAGDVGGLTGLSFGMGLGYRGFDFDYGLLPYGSLGLTHRLSVSMKWGGVSGETEHHLQSRAGPSEIGSWFESTNGDLP